MRKRSSIINDFTAYWGISIAILLATITLYTINAESFSRFLGELNPIAILSMLSILGYALLHALRPYGLSFYQPGNNQTRFKTLNLTLLLALVIIIIDVSVVFPENMNVEFPSSLFYYPVFGYVVEVLFHLTPLFILLSIANQFTKISDQTILTCILLVSALEPIFQLSLDFSAQVPTWTVAYVGIHIFIINLLQLITFWRFDFASMYAFRLTYYLLWHIIWGYLRLEFLF
jgi:hypothetical protein